MATRPQPPGPTQHTAGIFADMTVDGPEIGTLVLIVDRGKNLPNRKTMGKQNPYCAARLGKEAKKTDVDKRGGQTPRWDQELRFTVHDSPDYFNLKISVFSEDKRTELIGEAWIGLVDIIKPGGGREDTWQGLNFKGKYAGELRIELTYYDSRPRPEKVEGEEHVMADLRASQSGGIAGRVKRRPLPTNPAGSAAGTGSLTPDMISAPVVPARAKHGPRDFRTPPRANSVPVEAASSVQPALPPSNGELQGYGTHPAHASTPALPLPRTSMEQRYDAHAIHEESGSYVEPGYGQTQDVLLPGQLPDFLPMIPPSNQQRMQSGYESRQPRPQHAPAPNPIAPQHHAALRHSHSATSVPAMDQQDYNDGYHLRTDYPDPIPDMDYQHEQLQSRQRHSGVPQQWQNEYDDGVQERYDENLDEPDLAPPPPPVHSNSAPVVPHYDSSHYGSPSAQVLSSPISPYDNTSPHARHHSVPNSSPLQAIERTYGQPHRTPPHAGAPRDRHIDPYQTTSPPDPPYPHGINPVHNQSAPQLGRTLVAPRPVSYHQGSGGLYGGPTPPRPHPLSQEVSRARSPHPEYAHEAHGAPNPTPPRQLDYIGRELVTRPTQQTTPHSTPHQPSPAGSGPKPRSAYSIQFPVRAFESSNISPLSTSTVASPPAISTNRSTPARKSVSPNPSPTRSSPQTTIPYSPDSFDIHNPHAAASRAHVQGNSVSPHSPFAIRPTNPAHPRDPSTSKGPIVGWHGQEIDPSDHLPIDSWAPEPEKKTPTKTYGLGRTRDFGPRTLGTSSSNPTSANGGHGRQLSRDTVVNFRPSATTTTPTKPFLSSTSTPSSSPYEPSPSEGRTRLQKKTRPPSHSITTHPIQPLREHHNYNNSTSSPIPNPYDQQQDYPRFSSHPDGSSPREAGSGSGRGFYDEGGHLGDVALVREIGSIDIGNGGNGGNRRSLPAPVAFVPVRSHRDRKTFY